MKWSWRLGEFAGIGVYVHATFLLLLGGLLIMHLMAGATLASALAGIGFVLALFACVVLHEYGHALTARRFGIRTRDIVLLPIGGVARLERIPENPRQELWVAVAGPAVNLVIAVALFVWLSVTGTHEAWTQLGLASGSFLERLMLVNLILAFFNLIPAFPMDGGRVLRALLAMRMDYVRATHIAATIGQGVAFLLGFLGLFGNPILLFIALFVWIGAAQESSLAQMKDSLGGIPVERVMLTDYRALQPSDPLSRAVELTLAGSQKDFPVVVGLEVIGILTQADLLKALEDLGRDASVAQAMQREFATAEISEMTETVFQRLQDCNCHTIPVTQGERLVGLVTMENVGEFLRIQAALGR